MFSFFVDDLSGIAEGIEWMDGRMGGWVDGKIVWSSVYLYFF